MDQVAVAPLNGIEHGVLADEHPAPRTRHETRARIGAGLGRERPPSSFHLSSPPSSTCTASKPNSRSMNQTRVAHQVGPAL